MSVCVYKQEGCRDEEGGEDSNIIVKDRERHSVEGVGEVKGNKSVRSGIQSRKAASERGQTEGKAGNR